MSTSSFSTTCWPLPHLEKTMKDGVEGNMDQVSAPVGVNGTDKVDL